jgi:hypothetical protein
VNNFVRQSAHPFPVTKEGKERILYYPEIAERPGRRLEELKVGERVTVSVPMEAVGEIGTRAESLDIYDGVTKNK